MPRAFGDFGVGGEPDFDTEFEAEVYVFDIAANGAGVVWHQPDARALCDCPIMRRGEVGLHPHHSVGDFAAEYLVEFIAAKLIGLLLDDAVIDHVGDTFRSAEFLEIAGAGERFEMQIAQPLDRKLGPVGLFQLHRNIGFHAQDIHRAHGALQFNPVLATGFVDVVHDARRQPETAQAFGDGETDRATGFAFGQGRDAPHVRHGGFHIPRRQHDPPSFIRQPGAFGFAKQQRVAELVFQPGDGAARGIDG